MTDSDNLSINQSSSSAPVTNELRPLFSEHVSARLLQDRLELVEDLWETVVRSECPSDQAERLLRLKKLSNSNAIQEQQTNQINEIVILIGEMDLAEAISAARAFSLYFQLVNILEQRIEEDTYL